MGSNVVDVFFRLRGKMDDFSGEKGYFAKSDEVVGGVTLNHLTWASSLGVPTALAALQGEDEPGRSIRAAMQLHNVSSGALAVRAGASSSVSHVMLEASGARTILMAPHATAQLSASEVNELFVGALDRVQLVTTEVSQVPLDGVTALLAAATARKIPTVLDVDVPPSIAAGAAQLCESAADVLAVSRLPTVLKTTRTAALELLALDGADAGAAELSLDRLAVRVQLLTSAPLVAVTDGERGGALASAAGAAVALPPPPTGVAADSLDTTGAGDAFLGGLLAVLWRRGLGGAEGTAALPTTEDELTHALRVANAAGTAGCTVLGGLPPTDGSARTKVVALVGAGTDAEAWLPPARAAGAGGDADDCDAAEAGRAEVGISLQADAAAAAAAADDGALRAALEAASEAIDAVRAAGGHALVTSLGKSGAVGRRLAASLASTGARAFYVHAAEWAHGDLGNLAAGRDVLIALSHSGRTAEVAGVAREAAARGVPVVAVVGGGADAAAASPLGQAATHVVPYALPEAEPHGGVPSMSIVAQEMAANALVRSLAKRDGFDAARFKVNHPGGALGASL